MLASSFICGTNIHDRFTEQTFTQTGLIHLMVVSGSHLIFVSQLLVMLCPASVKENRWFAFFIVTALMIYSFITGFQAPVVRSLAGMLTHRLSHGLRWNWDFAKSQCFGSLLLLAVNPLWIQSFSFYLSWLAACSLSLAPLCFHRAKFWSHVFSSFSVQVVVATLAGAFSWLGLGMNIFVAPALGLILFPLSLFGVLIPWLHPLLDGAWMWLVIFLNWTLDLFPQENLSSFDNTPRWYFLAVWIALSHFLRRKRYENSAV